MLKDPGCLNLKKRENKSIVTAIQNLSQKLQPKLDVALVLDEWKVYQTDTDIPKSDSEERVDYFWNKVFTLKQHDDTDRYKVIPKLVKAGLTLLQMNVKSERSLSVNARLVTKDRAALGETTIIGLCTANEAVRFFDPVQNRPEIIPVTNTLRQLSGHHMLHIRPG